MSNSVENLPLTNARKYIDYIIILVNCICAQIVKMFTSTDEHFLSKNFFQKLGASGGSPSAHTTVVVSTACINWLNHGFQSSITMVSIIMMIIIIYDAMGVRNHVTKLNKIIKSLIPDDNHASHPYLNNNIGHTPMEVLKGLLFGSIMTLFLKKTSKLAL